MNQPTPLLDALISRLKVYCDQERGRKTELIDHLGIRAHMLSEWLSRLKNPGGEYTLAIQKWLDSKGA